MENKDFQKIQISLMVNSKSVMGHKINSLSLELAYPNSEGQYAWIGNGRKYLINELKFETFLNSENEEKYIFRPINWTEFNKENDIFIVDFLKTTKQSKLKFRLFLNNSHSTKIKTFEFWDTKKIHKTPFVEIKTEILEIGN